MFTRQAVLQAVHQPFDLLLFPIAHLRNLVGNRLEFRASVSLAATDAVIIAVRVGIVNLCGSPDRCECEVSGTICTVPLSVCRPDHVVGQPLLDRGVQRALLNGVTQVCDYDISLSDDAVASCNLLLEFLSKFLPLVFGLASVGLAILAAYLKFRPIQPGMIAQAEFELARTISGMPQAPSTDDLIMTRRELELMLDATALAANRYRMVEGVSMHDPASSMNTSLDCPTRHRRTIGNDVPETVTR
jgi:hypothetical protein